MSRIKVGAGAMLVLLSLIFVERSDVFLIYGISAVLHEMGHLLAAKRRKIKIKEIRIGISGARICCEEGSGSYLDELILCAAGPLVNVLTVLVGAAVFAWQKMSLYDVAASLEAFGSMEQGSHLGALAFFMLCSILQGGLNLLPIKTFDGGRILYCTIAMTAGQRAAERVLSVSGALCMLLIWTVALYLMLKLDAGLSIYTFAACVFLGTLRDRELIE